MSENRIDAGQIKETDKQLQYIGEARELITLISERLGRPLLSCIITFGCQITEANPLYLYGSEEDNSDSLTTIPAQFGITQISMSMEGSATLTQSEKNVRI